MQRALKLKNAPKWVRLSYTYHARRVPPIVAGPKLVAEINKPA